MPALSASHSAVKASPKPKTAAAPCRCDSQPPAAAPAKVPKNCTLEYTPVAVPLMAGGANLDTSEGRSASSKLNPVKNTTSAASVIGSDVPAVANSSCPANSTTTAPMNTVLPRPGRSACHSAGNINATE